MSGKKSFSTETSERYALALFELSEDSNILSNVEKNTKDFLTLYKNNKDLENFIKNPSNLIDTQYKAINQISQIMNFNKVFKNFLSILVKKRRIFYLEIIIKKFLKLVSKRRGELSASLVSAKKLDQLEIDNISKSLSSVVGKSLNLNYKHDENLIGGVKIQVGSLMIDSSIRNKLKKYEHLMKEI